MNQSINELIKQHAGKMYAKDIAAIAGCSVDLVRKYAVRLGVDISLGKAHLTSAKKATVLEYVRQNYDRQNAFEMGAAMGVTHHYIRDMAYILGVQVKYKKEPKKKEMTGEFFNEHLYDNWLIH